MSIRKYSSLSLSAYHALHVSELLFTFPAIASARNFHSCYYVKETFIIFIFFLKLHFPFCLWSVVNILNTVYRVSGYKKKKKTIRHSDEIVNFRNCFVWRKKKCFHIQIKYRPMIIGWTNIRNSEESHTRVKLLSLIFNSFFIKSVTQTFHFDSHWTLWTYLKKKKNYVFTK